MNYKGIIFDLDGTLIDSLLDLAAAINKVLANNNYPTHSNEKIESFVGSGIRTLVERALPEQDKNKETIDRIFPEMIETYSAACANNTLVYDGIPELLINLHEKGVKLAVLSNKADVLTKKIAEALFPGLFDEAIGLTTEETKKPNPINAIAICERWNLASQEVIYIGDSEVDLETASRGKLKAVSVDWGFRTRKELIDHGATCIISKPEELLGII